VIPLPGGMCHSAYTGCPLRRTEHGAAPPGPCGPTDDVQPVPWGAGRRRGRPGGMCQLAPAVAVDRASPRLGARWSAAPCRWAPPASDTSAPTRLSAPGGAGARHVPLGSPAADNRASSVRNRHRIGTIGARLVCGSCAILPSGDGAHPRQGGLVGEGAPVCALPDADQGTPDPGTWPTGSRCGSARPTAAPSSSAGGRGGTSCAPWGRPGGPRARSPAGGSARPGPTWSACSEAGAGAPARAHMPARAFGVRSRPAPPAGSARGRSSSASARAGPTGTQTLTARARALSTAGSPRDGGWPTRRRERRRGRAPDPAGRRAGLPCPRRQRRERRHPQPAQLPGRRRQGARRTLRERVPPCRPRSS